MLNVYEQVDANKRRSSLIIIIFALFIATVSYFIGRALGYGPGFIGLALIISGITTFIGYWNSDLIILAVSRARPAEKDKDRLFYSVAENISLAAGIPVPKLYVIEDSAPNAFAAGRDVEHASVAVTTGLLDKLDRTELEGVIAHEISHVKNYDMRLMSVVVVLIGMVTLLSDWLLHSTFGIRREKNQISGILFIVGLVLALLSPLIGKLIQLALSRRRELLADAGAVFITRQPAGLTSALIKISRDTEPLEAANKATAPLYIVNPLKGNEGRVDWFANLFRTHPPIEQRIKLLQEMM
ncbi:zinc metalloprotease HtpX [Candidatus Microgenomates bacterium]|jgi:heat shock protein HtpX|nr:MAG: zinc metalloprotease HtpX [Candidatus Microgenomates bacterium]